jgi:hypothetical protein
MSVLQVEGSSLPLSCGIKRRIDAAALYNTAEILVGFAVSDKVYGFDGGRLH